jgi:hypothetical protein
MDSIRGAMAANSCLDGRSAWRQGSGGGRRGRNRQIHNLIGVDGPRARKVSPCGANIKRFGKIKKFDSGRIGATHEHWDLHVNPLRTPALSGG